MPVKARSNRAWDARLRLIWPSALTNEMLTDARYAISTSVLAAGTTGEVLIEFPAMTLRPGEFPLYFALGPEASDFDIVDNLSAPLIVGSTKSAEELGFDPARALGYFSLPNRRVN